MAAAIDRDEVARLLREEQAQLVEVLPADEYEDEHLPGAINIPLKLLDATTAGQRLAARRILVPPGKFKWGLKNNAGQTMASSGNTFKYNLYDEEIQ